MKLRVFKYRGRKYKVIETAYESVNGFGWRGRMGISLISVNENLPNHKKLSVLHKLLRGMNVRTQMQLDA